MHPRRNGGAGALLVIGGLALTAVPASAQYFGQNKVQYETFDFQVLETEHFDIYFYPRERPGVEVAAPMAERWHARLSQLLDHTLSGRQPLILYASPSDFQQTNVVGGPIGEGTGGVTEGARRRIVMPFGATLGDTDHVLGHELVHAFQYDISSVLSRGNRRPAGIGRLPLWFVEGMAEYLSIGAHSPLTAMWVRDAVVNEKLPAIRELNDPRYFPYRWGHALWAYIGGRWGDTAVADLLVSAIDSGRPEEAFESVLGVTQADLTTAWHAALRDSVQAQAHATASASAHGRLLTEAEGLGSQVNVSPALSPDGRRIAFLSSRGLFSIDLYVADVASGEIVARLTRTDVDPHLESLQFIASAGTWDPAGRRLAVTAVADGRPVLAIYDIETARKVREIGLGDLDGALNPTWSPDGRRIAFVGVAGGLGDLYAVTLDGERLERLTEDAYSELHPAWSPDGRSIACATDRFTANLEAAAPGDLRLGILDLESRRMRPVAAFDRGKAISPQWTADGGLFFVADQDGISDVYEIASGGGTPRRVTRVATGVSGITGTSPALSAAAGRIVFPVFEQGAYRLYVAGAETSPPAVLTQATPAAAPRAADAGALPPFPSEPRATTALLADRSLHARVDTSDTEPYRPRLGLDYIGRPTIAVGADRFGGFGGGGISFFLSDMLGDHSLAAAFQATTSFDEDFSVADLGGAVMYQNLRRRLNWGVAVDQTPYRTGFFTQSAGVIGGRPTVVEDSLLYRQSDRGVTGLAAYPFNRAQRLEGGVSYRNLHFEQILRTTAFDLETGDVVFEDRQEIPGLEPLHLGQASAALVYDTSSFGATSPVLGQRYRLEVAPTFGSLRYTGVLADYRRYVMPARLYTIAGRVMHYGRYGGDAGDPRLFPLFLGYPSLVRGYDVGTFEAGECPPTEDGSCDAFDRLLGTRMLVANLEFRFPLLRPFTRTEAGYGPIPVEVAFFGDAGIAWTADDTPSFAGGDRRGVSSVGVALRVNAFGFAIVQLDASRPLQRPGRGRVYQFSLSPGF
jgi:Tol biopolymer transport system component